MAKRPEDEVETKLRGAVKRRQEDVPTQRRAPVKRKAAAPAVADAATQRRPAVTRRKAPSREDVALGPIADQVAEVPCLDLRVRRGLVTSDGSKAWGYLVGDVSGTLARVAMINRSVLNALFPTGLTFDYRVEVFSGDLLCAVGSLRRGELHLDEPGGDRLFTALVDGPWTHVIDAGGAARLSLHRTPDTRARPVQRRGRTIGWLTWHGGDEPFLEDLQERNDAMLELHASAAPVERALAAITAALLHCHELERTRGQSQLARERRNKRRFSPF